MTVRWLIWIVFQLLIGYNLVVPWIIFLLALANERPGNRGLPELKEQEEEADFAIIVTAYQQTELLPEVIQSILNSNYQRFLLYVVADDCDISALRIAHEKVILLRPEQALKSNIASHFFAISNFKRAHTHLTIIDSDNIVDPQYLRELNKYFLEGYAAVQGTRAAKNLDTTISRLDGARDIYYHFYDGQKLFAAGSSATLAGSAMAFTTELYVNCLKEAELNAAGFDKLLQFEIVRRGYTIAYAPNAIVYDEKTANSDQLVKQRSRWISTWFRFFGFGFILLGSGLKEWNRNKFLFGLILIRPPLFMFLLLSAILMIVNFWFSPVSTLVWFSAFLVFIAGFLMALKRSHTDRRIYQALVNIPVFVFYQLVALLKIRKAQKLSVATRHIYKPGPVKTISSKF